MAANLTFSALPHKAYLLPDAVPMWPPVWWTWLAVAAVVLILFGAILLLIIRHKKRAYRREALAALKHADDKVLDKELVVLCHELIRRCLVSENKSTLAALPAPQLFNTLDQKNAAKHRFSSLPEDFISGPYRGAITLSAAQREHILSTTRYWIRKHHA
ncbi:DUF4381 domain-containing protein [Marinomonas arenicola]|uniref:DUF4381 domain-containing protein n=1 Tax=Marinomonas arenicola TaxID=569601 RepID=UPI00311FF12B